jgi:hypothetical protein
MKLWNEVVPVIIGHLQRTQKYWDERAKETPKKSRIENAY